MSGQHSKANEHKHHDHRHSPAWKRWHRNWRTWVIVALMLIAMAFYVLSDDEALQPGAPPGEPMPAAAGP